MKDVIKKASQIIKQGGLVIFPTDTVLALSCDMHCENALKKIYDLKKRHKNKPLSLLISDLRQIEEIVILNKNAYNILAKYPKGSVTLVCKLRDGFNFSFASDDRKIGFRLTYHPLAKAIIEKISSALIATSVNYTNEPSITNSLDIAKSIREQIDLIIEGKSDGLIASKVIDVSQDEIVTLR